jgi:predicted PurR-regulated permease PerM
LKSTPPFLSRPYFFAVVFFALLLFLLYQMARLLAPFLSALLWAAVLTLVLYPLHTRILRVFKGRAGLAAAATTLITVLAIVLPAIVLLALCAFQAIALYEWASGGIQSGRLIELWNGFSSSLSEKFLAHPSLAAIDIKGFLVKGIGEVSSALAGQIGPFLKNTLLLALELAVMLVALFFFLKKGEFYYQSAMEMLPFSSEQKHSISRKVYDTFQAVMHGVFLIALIQGLVTGIGFALFGVPYAVFWGFLAAVLAILPVGGAAIVWVPGMLYLFLAGAKIQAMLLLAWGLVLVTLPDNFLKPLFIGKKAKLPTLFLFIGILGGLQVYGILGVLLGPLVVTLLTAFIQIYREEFVGRQGK